MTITEASHGRVLAYLTQQELELLHGCVFEALHSVDSMDFKCLIGYERDEAKVLMRQVAAAIDMINRGAEPGAFGQLQPKSKP